MFVFVSSGSLFWPCLRRHGQSYPHYAEQPRVEKYATGLQLVGLKRHHSTIQYIVQTPSNVVAQHATVIHGVGSLRFTGAVSTALYAGNGSWT